MKSIIVILATIALGIYIGGTLINGSDNSLRTGAASIVTEVNERINNQIGGI